MTTIKRHLKQLLQKIGEFVQRYSEWEYPDYYKDEGKKR